MATKVIGTKATLESIDMRIDVDTALRLRALVGNCSLPAVGGDFYDALTDVLYEHELPVYKYRATTDALGYFNVEEA